MPEPRMIQPALTAEEWAEFLATKRVTRVFPGFLHYTAEYPSFPGAAEFYAALCLHGRLTWEVVDALRECVAGAGESGVPLETRELADATADLLESLLPPRTPEPVWIDRHAGRVEGFPNIAPELTDPDYRPFYFSAQVDRLYTYVMIRSCINGVWAELDLHMDGFSALREFVASVDAAEAAMRPKADAG